MACDICGKTGTPLADLLESYQTDDIKAICPDCERIVNDKKGKLMTMVLNMLAVLLKRFMTEKRERAGIPASPKAGTPTVGGEG